MKAWVLHGIGDIRFEDVQEPAVEADEVLVRVKAAGICGSDVPRVFSTGAHKMPLTPGHEFSGIVEGIGASVDPIWTGKRVGVYPLIPCGKCECCKAGHPEICRSYNYLGSRCNGGFAEYVAVPAKNLIELPDSISFEQAAMLEPAAVAFHAVRRVFGDGASEGEAASKKIVVCGLGTIGLLTVMVLKSIGCDNIVVIGNRESRKEAVKALGVSEDVYVSTDDAGMRKVVGSSDSSVKPGERKRNRETLYTDKINNADVFFECVGKNECVSLGIECLKPLGHLVTVGNPYSDMSLSKDTYWKILRNQLTVTGTWNSTFLSEHHKGAFDANSRSEAATDDWETVIDLISSGKLHPETLITHRLALNELDKGLMIMRDKTEDYIKVMVV